MTDTNRVPDPSQPPVSGQHMEPIKGSPATSVGHTTSPVSPTTGTKSSDTTRTHEPALGTPHENLINQARKSNEELAKQKAAEEAAAHVKHVNVKTVSPVTLDAIKDALKDGGMDSMSQAKTYARIVEILGWDS